ncbi:hypothetical protein [Yeguia hominis]|uniref:hypothetical protein n=1 Tax=Yeguia hominis TaxID=2763662 RepID=UPI003D2AF66F
MPYFQKPIGSNRPPGDFHRLAALCMPFGNFSVSSVFLFAPFLPERKLAIPLCFPLRFCPAATAFFSRFVLELQRLLCFGPNLRRMKLILNLLLHSFRGKAFLHLLHTQKPAD